MGAGGSTAASCSSLDLTNGQVPDRYRYYRQQQQQQQNRQYLHEDRLPASKHKPRGAAAACAGSSAYKLKKSSSQFNLASPSDIRNTEPYLHHLVGEIPGDALGHASYGIPSRAPTLEAYHLTNSDMARPQAPPVVRVLPPLPPPPSLLSAGGGAKKSNAGVASRILHQRQQQQQLKKFSDSLPSLNNLLDPATIQEISAINQRQNHSQQASRLIHQSHQSHHNHHVAPFECRADRNSILKPSSPFSSKHMEPSSQQRLSAIQAKRQRLLLDKQQQQQHEKVTNKNLVPDERYRAPTASHQLITRQHQRHTQMKRATSLSSLHNLNQSHHQPQHHLQHQHQSNQQPRTDCQRRYQADKNNNQHTQMTRRPPSNNARCRQAGDANRSPRPPSLSSCTTSDFEGQQQQQHIFQQQHMQRAQRGLQSASCDLKSAQLEGPHDLALVGAQYRLPPQMAPPPPASRQQALLQGSRGHKYSQAPSKNANRYRSKQQQAQQQHQLSPQQVGCPVLPPMPRSQSLHELIQLRATENGQRMRTTGTLRGPFGSGAGEPANKVNLVAELLESRRQQRQATQDADEQVATSKAAVSANSETLLSQGSSTDDGIHDVSISGGHAAEPTHASHQKFSSKNNQSRSSTSSQESGDKTSRQRFFKQQRQVVAAAAATKQINDLECVQEAKSDINRAVGRARHQRDVHKSTLKRSVSHSALHESAQEAARNSAANCSDSYDQDGDESDDLNELARFLYQFKQRQARAAAHEISPSGAGKSAAQQAAPANGAQEQQANGANTNNFQQSPNSTTSSSGFASSTSHSISSTGGGGGGGGQRDKFRSVSSSSSREVDAHLDERRVSRKKYPAPPRPDEGGASKSATGKCARVAASSSLLSIVDECQQAAAGQDSGHHQSEKLDSRPAGELVDEFKFDGQLEHLRRYTHLRQMSQSELALNHLTSTVAQPAEVRRQKIEKSKSGQAKPKSSNQLHHQHDCKRNLALGRDGGGAVSTCATCAESSAKSRPYASRLFNLIRRISDKSEVARPSSRSSSCASESAAAAGGRRNASDARQAIDGARKQEINQNLNGRANPNNNASGQLERPAAAAAADAYGAAPSSLAGQWASSESMCDLNFDCDFELIKKCGGSAAAAAARESGQASGKAGRQRSLFAGLPDESGGGRKDSRDRKRKNNSGGQGGAAERPIIDSPAGRANNWRLVPAASSLMPPAAAAAHYRCSAAAAADSANSQHGNNNYNNSAGSCEAATAANSAAKSAQLNRPPAKVETNLVSAAAATKLGGSSCDIRRDELTRGAAMPPPKPSHGGKLKWSASSWFLGGSGSASSSSKKNGGSNKSDAAQEKVSGDKAAPTSKQQAVGGNNAPARDSRSYLARLLPGASGASSLSPVSRSDSKCDTQDDAMRQRQQQQQQQRCDMISEADQLLVELDQSLDLVSGSARRRQRRRSHRASATPQPPLVLPWWQQVSSKISEEEALAMHEAQVSALSADEDGASLAESDSESDTDATRTSDSDDERDNDDADYASINRALINETFDVDLGKTDEGCDYYHLGRSEAARGRLAEMSILHAGSPSNSFTFSAPSSPSPPPPPPSANRSPGAPNSSRQREIDGGNVRTTAATSGTPGKQAGDCTSNAVCDGERSLADNNGAQQRSEGGARVIPASSSKFAYARSAKAPPAAANDEQARAGVCCAAPKDAGDGQHDEIESAPKKSNKCANSDTFTKASPVAAELAELAEPTTAEKLRGQVARGAAQLRGVVAQDQHQPRHYAAAAPLARDPCDVPQETSVARKLLATKATPSCDKGAVRGAPEDQMSRGHSSDHAIDSAPATPNGNARHNKCSLGGAGVKGRGSSGERACDKIEQQKAPLEEEVACPIHGQTSACCACRCAHASRGQGDSSAAKGNLKRQQQQQRVLSQRHLDTNSAERAGYDTPPEDNGASRGASNSPPSRFSSSSPGEGTELASAAAEPEPCDCCATQVANGGSSHAADGGGRKLACHQYAAVRAECAKGSACRVGCSSPGSHTNNKNNGLCNGSPASGGSVAPVRTKAAAGKLQQAGAVVCSQRAVTAGETAAAGTENNKLIIREKARLGAAAADAQLASPAANEQQPRAAGNSSQVSHRAAAAASRCRPAGNCAGRHEGCTMSSGVADSRHKTSHGSAEGEGASSSSPPRVTYYHYSHETKNFAPTASDDEEPKLREDAPDRRPLDGKQQEPVKCAHMIAAAQSTQPENEICRRASVSCHYHLCNSSCAASPCAGRRLSDEDVKGASCCSHYRAPGTPPKNKTPAPDALRSPMAGGHKDVAKSPAASCCRVVSPPPQQQLPAAAKYDAECHCCRAAANGPPPDAPNGQVAACLAKLQMHSECHLSPSAPIVSPQQQPRCNPICRSNSELAPDASLAQGKKGRAPGGQDRRVGDILFGRLRSSLLNQRHAEGSAAPCKLTTSKQHQLHSASQVSLANGGGHYAAAAAAADNQRMLQSILQVGVGSSPLMVANDFDDNFILKRKTPNAGLKSRC